MPYPAEHKADVQINLRRMNWLLLRRQKAALVDVVNELNRKVDAGPDDDALLKVRLLSGLVNFLDYVQDEAADFLDLETEGNEIVFGPTCRHVECGSMTNPFTGVCYDDPTHPSVTIPAPKEIE